MPLDTPPKQMSSGGQRWEQLLRYRYIELVLLWEGQLTTKQLCDTFSIGRQQADQRVIPLFGARAVCQTVLTLFHRTAITRPCQFG